ncbi:hypothetical protein O181_045310 [Austropuccinia psidii MF-1]|uniref:BAH domain-containing protein n=1 Tax=Austropuccinia psidii MF-1 TaxID=1389203 RepID=A0A9Q3DR74_9BASI|nr:hypothetical protein [Austropuccinia psidii MF-1]
MWSNAVERKACIQIVESCFNFHNRNGRLISSPFEELPDPNEPQNALYYDRVKQPRSLKIVLNSLKQESYQSIKEFYADLKLVFSNLSFVVNKSTRDWQDAIRMNQFVEETWQAKVNEGVLPPLDGILNQDSSLTNDMPYSSRPSTSTVNSDPFCLTNENTQNKLNSLDQSDPSSNSKLGSATTAPQKRSRSPSTASTATVEEPKTSTPTPNLSNSNGATKQANKRARKTLTNPLNAYEESSTPLKDRFPDSETGWMKENSNLNIRSLGSFILSRIKAERLPPEFSFLYPEPRSESSPELTIFQETPDLKLDQIQERLQTDVYDSIQTFDQDLHKVFLHAETSYAQDQERLGGIYLLKRLYQELTQGDGSLALRDSVPIGGARALASVCMGPGNRTLLPRNEEPVKLRAKDKSALEGVRHKGDYFKVGDWIHLFNHDDPSRPIIAQIFHTYRRVDTGRRVVNVCWYYRPEETVHLISRTFMQNEVFKTGNFIDHSVEDILGRCLVMFYTKFLRGRPSAPMWTPDMATYICEHRYKDDIYNFKKIKNWDSCVPANVRNEAIDENFNAYPTPLPVSSLARLPSPFLSPPTTKPKGSGEPIVMGPEEAVDELPKDQMKCHDLSLTLAQVKTILGTLPAHPPRPTHVTENMEESSQPTRSLAQSSLPTPTPPIPTPASMPILPQPSVSFQPIPKPLDLNSPELKALLANANHGFVRPTPCWLDVIAAQECFEKLPESFLNDSESEGEGDMNEEKKQKGDLVWFLTPPLRLITKNRKIEKEPVKHSQVYLNWLKNEKEKAETGPKPVSNGVRQESELNGLSS